MGCFVNYPATILLNGMTVFVVQVNMLISAPEITSHVLCRYTADLKDNAALQHGYLSWH
jgi:hypothetical protein